MQAVNQGPLAGLRILDLTAVVLGPLATQILGDQGADVIKVESPEGDMMRANGVSKHAGMSSIYLTINRNKRSLVLDLKRPEGVATLLALAKTADVFVHNMRVPAIERLGLGYGAVRAARPDIVYCVATGYQEGGAFAGKPVFDDIVQSGCGLVDLSLKDSGQPRYMPTLVADKAAGVAVAQAITAALVHRARTGEGQYLEVPMFETMTAFTLVEHLGGMAFEPSAGDAGYARLLNGGRSPVRVADGYVTVLPYSPSHWAALLKELARPDLLQKYGAMGRSQLNARIRELYADLTEVLGTLTCDECLALCERLDIPCARIYALEELQKHPQLASVQLFEQHEHPTEGATIQVRPTARFSATPTAITRQAPVLGQHSAELLLEAGWTQAEVDRLLATGVLKVVEAVPEAARPA